MPRYRTTRPIVPLNADRATIEAVVNDELMIQLRRYELTDLPHIHRLRTQEKVMVQTSTGVVDADLETSQKWMNRKLPPNDAKTFDLVIWAQERGSSWEHIGSIGVHSMSPVPILGYMIREEWWGRSIVTTAVKAFLLTYWALDRKTVELNTDSAEDDHERYITRLESDQTDLGNSTAGMKSEDDCDTVPEILLAEIEQSNIGSMRVVERCGFRYRDRESVVEPMGTAARNLFLCTMSLAMMQLMGTSMLSHDEWHRILLEYREFQRGQRQLYAHPFANGVIEMSMLCSKVLPVQGVAMRTAVRLLSSVVETDIVALT